MKIITPKIALGDGAQAGADRRHRQGQRPDFGASLEPSLPPAESRKAEPGQGQPAETSAELLCLALVQALVNAKSNAAGGGKSEVETQAAARGSHCAQGEKLPQQSPRAQEEAPSPGAPSLLLAAVPEDTRVSGAILQHAAHVVVDSEAGKLSLRIRFKDGVADVRAHGQAAPLLQAREADLRLSLLRQGITLGQLSSSLSDAASPPRSGSIPRRRRVNQKP